MYLKKAVVLHTLHILHILVNTYKKNVIFDLIEQ